MDSDQTQGDTVAGTFDRCGLTVSAGKQTWSVAYDMGNSYADAAELESLYGKGIQTTEVSGVEANAKVVAVLQAVADLNAR